MTNTIRLQADERALFQNLREAFSPASVYGELLQNARRAGATLIEVTFDGETLSFTDNGHGIADLQQLLLKATSEWAADVIEEDRPFGMGFLAALYASESIRVATRTATTEGQGFVAMTEHVLAGDTVAVVPVNRGETGTTITLYGFTLPVHSGDPEHRLAYVNSMLDKAVRGFPVPVVFNGKPLARPDADDDTFITTSIGRVRLRLSDSHPRLYIQGLPVETDSLLYGNTIVHLDKSFRAKLPDRLHLVDSTGARKRIKGGLMEAAQEKLRLLKTTMEPQAFLAKHAKHCSMWDCRELLDDVPFALGEWFVDWQRRRPGFTLCDDERQVLKGILSKDEILSKGVILLPEEDASLAQAWAAASGHYAWETTGYVSDKHWLSQAATEELIDEDFSVEVDAEGQSQLIELTEYQVRFSVVDRIRIRHVATGEAHEVEMVVHDDRQECWRRVIHVVNPKAIVHSIRLLSAYEDEDDKWHEHEERADISTLASAFAELVATSPEHLLEMRLTRANTLTDQSPQFAGRSFIVHFDDSGALREIRAAA